MPLRLSIVSLFALLSAVECASAGGFPCDKFTRDDTGRWHVLQPLTIEGPGGRKIDFTPDETYAEGHEKLGLDMAKLLNANCSRK